MAKARSLYLASITLFLVSVAVGVVAWLAGPPSYDKPITSFLIFSMFLLLAAMFFIGLNADALRNETFTEEDAQTMRASLPKWRTFLTYKRDAPIIYAMAKAPLWRQAIFWIYMSYGILVAILVIARIVSPNRVMLGPIVVSFLAMMLSWQWVNLAAFVQQRQP